MSARMRTIIAAAIATVLALCGNARAGEACRHVLNMDPVFIGNWEWLYIPTENRAELAEMRSISRASLANLNIG